MDGEIMIYCPYGVERFKEFFNNKRREMKIEFSRFFIPPPHRLLQPFFKASKFSLNILFEEKFK